MSHMGKLVDAKQRKRIQNRAAQRTYRGSPILDLDHRITLSTDTER